MTRRIGQSVHRHHVFKLVQKSKANKMEQFKFRAKALSFYDNK